MVINIFRRFLRKNPRIKSFLSPLINFVQANISRKKYEQLKMVRKMSELLIVDPVLKVDDFNGIFSMSKHSDLFIRLLIENKYEPEQVALCHEYLNKKRDIIDVGANIGFYTILFAKSLVNNKVLSIEPASNALKHLYHNIEINGVLDRVTVFEGVASEKPGTTILKIVNGKEEYSTLGSLVHPSVCGTKYDLVEVKATTLDNIVESMSLDPGFIKVDVEGSENLVFKGALNVLTKKRPVILSELSDYLLRNNGSSAEEILYMIKQCGYDIYDAVNPKNDPGKSEFADIICFPKEMNVQLNK